MSESWSSEEVEATVADYLHMLTLELGGQQYNKTQHRRSLVRNLSNRSEGAVERKHQNISAILIELGCPYISGYKPLANYQSLLYEVVVDHLKSNEQLDRTALAAVQMPSTMPLIEDFSKIVVVPPGLTRSVREPTNHTYPSKDRHAVKRDYIDREARNASLGLAGEEFVVQYERWRLSSDGHERLANKVEHVAQTKGDGLGFDVLSFDTNGRERLIEVKTTSFGKETPFFITKNEVELSHAQADCFHLYRLFEFRKYPQMFSLEGPVDRHCHLNPTTFQGRFS
jgi:hypothetical protein